MTGQLTLSELNGQIKGALMDAFPETVWLIAEISELKENRAGHCYLELIEKDPVSNEILARARATVWSYTYRMLKPYFETSTNKAFSSGIKVLVRVSIEFHEAYGFSLNIKDIDPTYTLGDLAIKKKEIIEKLQQDGVFEMNKGLALPLVPQNIAIISSATAAGYEDFVEQLEGNPYGFAFKHQLFEAFMQGNEAVPSIIASLERIYEVEGDFDVVALIRGGGAQADLSCFDDYDLAYFITQFPLPVVTGIGHEKDESIADLVAHTKMKTPTAVAEFLITGALGFYEHILGIESQIMQKTREVLDTHEKTLERVAAEINSEGQLFLAGKKEKLGNAIHRFKSSSNQFVFQKEKKLDEVEGKLGFASRSFLGAKENGMAKFAQGFSHGIGQLLKMEGNKLGNVGLNLKNNLQRFFLNEKNMLGLNQKSVQLLDPKNILERGYTLTLKNGELIKSRKKLKPGDEIETRFADGSVASKIK